ncbi:hypothetical protein BUALT_Bualt10G0073100 [Buddleja alternifolia]|uniref:F-box domain-containing protein n=1 Tax=Buddleja alternifolia TaxID=168488 RepID=A0AAV6WVZ1_9LAMI|nr:hypothetical protein BUALT_Bualt10G0073100 [Buddleja alternifolia]
MNISCIRRIGGVMEEDRKALRTPSSTGVSQFCLMDLPTAVLDEILFRLPIYFIMKVKLVCRALYKLLSDPDFDLNYSKHSPFVTFLLPGPNDFEEHPILNLHEICVDSHDQHIVKKRQITVEYGFGFCRSTNHCKILKIVSNSRDAPESRDGEILTVGADDGWRVLDRVANPTIPYPFASFDLAFVNEAFHWIANDFGLTWIFTFDLEEEKMGRLSHPHGLELKFNCMQLTSTNNQLCLLDGSSPDEIVLWKMKEYGVAESWTKDMVLDISVSQKVVPRRQQGKLECGNGCYAVAKDIFEPLEWLILILLSLDY